MFKRFVIIFLACAAATVVLFLTLLTDPSDSQQGKRSDVQMDPDIAWNLPDSARPGLLAPGRGTPLNIRTKNERGQIFEFQGDSLDPLDNAMNMVRLIQPVSRIHLKPGERVLEIRADEGTFIAPGLQPRSGDFQGNVVVTLFETQGGKQINLSPDSPHIALRIFLDEASFDLEAGSIDSEGPVYVTSRRFEFKGRGLRMTYNEVRKRLQELIITRGESLRLTRHAPKKPTEDPAPAQPVSDAGDDATAAPLIQYYKAVFHDEVVITEPTGGIRDCNRMEITFGIERGEKDDQLLQNLGPRRKNSKDKSSRIKTGASAVSADPVTQVLLNVIAQTGRDSRSLFTPRDDDIVVTWKGKLTVLPQPDKPASLKGKNDFLFDLYGAPMRITTVKEDLVINAAKLSYLNHAARLKLDGDAEHLLTFIAEQWGVMRTDGLTIDVKEERAIFHGAGAWKAHGERNVIAEIEPERQFGSRYDRLPPGTTLAWHDKLVVNFYMREDGRREGLGDIKAVERAVFHGDVNIYHPDFDLRADSMTAALLTPDAETGKQRLNDMRAQGNIHVISRADDPDDQMNLRSRELIVGLETLPNGNLRPTGVLAKGAVRARQRELTLMSNELLVELQQSDDDDTTLRKTRPEPSTSKVEYKRITARDDVRVEIEQSDDTVEISANTLVVEGDEIQFFGQDNQPASMATSKGMIVAQHLVLDQVRETLHAIGAGTFDIFAAVLEEDGDHRFMDRELLLSTTWRDNMHYDNKNNYVQFIGNVLSRAKRENSTSQLRADDVRLDLAVLEDTGGAGGDNKLLSRGNRSLDRIAAHGNVQFIAADWGRFGADKPQTRVTIEGQVVTFESATQRVQVIGQGRMGVEDYSEKDVMERLDADPLAQVSGRGATLFTWADQLNLDFKHNDMLILGQVQMMHVPQGKSINEGVQVDCRRLVADLIETGGLNMLHRDKVDHVNLREVLANDDVRVIGHGHEIYTDTLDYTHYDQIMMLEANAGNNTTVHNTESNFTTRARKIKWHLQDNRIEIINVGRGTLPVRR